MKLADKILDRDQLVAQREAWRQEGKAVVQCHGCFDIVHPGHIRYLKFARELGDALVVSVSADAVVGKGDFRPYINQELRLENLAALEFVDRVCLDDNDWAGPILEAVKPDIYVKGKEYETNSDRRFARERELVESYGGRVVFSSGDVVYSSTHILDQFRERFPMERERLAAFCGRHGVDRGAMNRLLSSVAGKRVLVLGDPVLDQYVHCDRAGVASESPILSVSPIREEWFLGAGALIAAQICELGAEAGFLTCLPPSEAPSAGRFRQDLESVGIAVHAVDDDAREVAVKTRYLVDDSKVFKVDTGRPAPLSTSATSGLVSALEGALRSYDALVVTDFGYGMFNAELIDAVSRVSADANKPYYLDVSHTRRANLLRFHGARLATPTEQELRFAFADSESGMSNLASRFFQETHTEQLVLTLGKRGVILFRRPERPRQRLKTEFIPALESTAVDTIGAGDVFLTATLLADLAGAPLEHGAYLGSAVAAMHIAQLGNRPVNHTELQRYLDGCAELSH